MLIARGGQVHAIAVKDSKITSSARLDGDQITAICTQDSRAYFGTEGGSLWGWKFAEANSKPEVIQLSAHGSKVRAVTLNSNGQILSCDDRGVVLVNSPSIAAATEPSTDAPPQTSFTFSARPTTVIAESGTIFAAVASNLETYSAGVEASPLIELSKQTVTCLAIHATSKRIAACDESGQLSIQHDAGQAFKVVSLPIKDVRSLAWSDDGSRIAVTNGSRVVTVEAESATVESQCLLESPAGELLRWMDESLWFLDSKAGLRRMQLPSIHWSVALGEEGSGVAWSSGGQTIAGLTRQGTIARFDSADGEEKARVATGQSECRSLTAIEGTDDFAFLGSNANAMIFAEDGTANRIPISSAIGLRQLTSSVDGRFLYTINSLGKIIAWDRSLPATTAVVVPCDVSCDFMIPLNQEYLVAASDDANTAVIIPDSQQSLLSLRVGGPPSSVVLASDGSMAAFADGTESAKLYPLNGSERSELRSDGVTFQQISLNADGTRAATLVRTDANQNELVIWDTDPAQVLTRCELPKTPKQVCFSDNASEVAVAFEDGHCEIFDVKSATMLESTPAQTGLESFAFAGGDAGLILADGKGNVSLQPLLALGHVQTDQNAIVALEIVAGDSPRLVCCSRDGRVSLWDTNDLSGPCGTLEGISGPLVGCRLSPDRRYLSVLYEDPKNTICVWNVNELSSATDPVKPSAVINNSVPVRCSAFTTDSQFLLVGADNGNVFAWNVSDARLVATFSRHNGPVLDIQPTDEPGVFLSGGGDQSIRSSQFPAVISSVDTEVPREVMIETMAVADLDPPKDLEDDYRDPIRCSPRSTRFGSKHLRGARFDCRRQSQDRRGQEDSLANRPAREWITIERGRTIQFAARAGGVATASLSRFQRQIPSKFCRWF